MASLSAGEYAVARDPLRERVSTTIVSFLQSSQTGDAYIIYVLQLCITQEKHDSFFQGSLDRLNEAAELGFSLLETQCHKEKDMCDDFYPTIPLTIALPTNLIPHQYSQQIAPASLSSKLTPVYVSGDGNCLFRYVTFAC